MTGEMTTVDREEWPTHFAIAEAVGGTVQPFDVYQGPYIVVGADMRVGTPPYQLAVQHMGVIRLWLTDEGVYREDTDALILCIPWDEESAVSAAIEAMQPPLSKTRV